MLSVYRETPESVNTRIIFAMAWEVHCIMPNKALLTRFSPSEYVVFRKECYDITKTLYYSVRSYPDADNSFSGYHFA